MTETSQSLVKLGNDLYEAGDFCGARLHYEAAIQTDPDCVAAIGNCGVALADMEALYTAEVYARRALYLEPTSAEQLNNLANILLRQKRFGESAEYISQALMLDEKLPGVWYNAALLNYKCGRFDIAQNSMEQSIALSEQPASPQTLCDYAHFLMATQSTFEKGLDIWEARWTPGGGQLCCPFPGLPGWRGGDLSDKTLLLYMEQGFGDIIMMLRLVLVLQTYAKHVIVAVPTSMVRLVKEQGWNVSVIDFDDMKDCEFDLHISSFSAIRFLHNRLYLMGAPYLKSGVQYTTKVDKFKIGLCWASGTPQTRFTEQRKVELSQLLTLASIPRVELVSLQKNEPDCLDISAIGAEFLISDPSAKCVDWLDTARVISELDLVVAVDTAVAHLAAAMGKPTIMLSQYSRCWRWWNAKSGSGRPWYSTMMIVQQKRPDDWKEAVQDVKTCVQHLLGKADEDVDGPTSSSGDFADDNHFGNNHAVVAGSFAATSASNGAD